MKLRPVTLRENVAWVLDNGELRKILEVKLISDRRRLPHEKFCDLHIKYNDKFKKNEMGWMCGTQRQYGKSMRCFGRKTCRKESNLKTWA
jgi:hypothetical protein